MIRRSPSNADRRVLAVIRWPVGGIRTYLLYNYPLLMQAGFRFTLVGPDDDSFRRLGDDFAPWPGVEFVPSPVHGQRCALRRTVSRLLSQDRYALIHSQGLTAGVEAALANYRRGLPHVITSHDVLRRDQFRGWGGRLKLAALSWLVNRADSLVAVSHDAEQNHRAYLAPSGRGRCRLVTIVNGIETARFHSDGAPLDRTLRATLGLAPDAYLIGFLGRFMEQKGFLVLVDALDRVLGQPGTERVHLLAVGSGDYVAAYRAAVDSRPNLSGRVTFLDHTANVRPLLAEIDLLAMPSLWEACPLLPMEAMCAGVPVLGSDCIGLREVLAGSPSRMVAAGDAAALAEGLRQAIGLPWTEEAVQYAPIAQRRFDVRQSVQQLRELFESAVT